MKKQNYGSKNIFLFLLIFSCIFSCSNVLSAEKPIRIFIIHDPLSYTNLNEVLKEWSYSIERIETERKFYQYVRGIINKKRRFIVSNKKVNFFEASLDFVGGHANADTYEADLILSFGPLGDAAPASEEIQMQSMATLKIISTSGSGEVSAQELLASPDKKKLLEDRLNKILDYAPELMSVKADKIIDSRRSMVGYEFLTQSKDRIWIQMDFTDGEEEQPQDVKFALHGQKNNGEYEYIIPTDDGCRLKIKFWVQDNKIVQAHIGVDYNSLKTKVKEKTFSIASCKGYKINFIFEWDDKGEIIVVKIKPAEHPYLPRFLKL